MNAWSTVADRVLEEVYRVAREDGGRLPSRQEIIDAYPFGERRMWPYKVWLRRVKVWREQAGKLERWTAGQ